MDEFLTDQKNICRHDRSSGYVEVKVDSDTFLSDRRDICGCTGNETVTQTMEADHGFEREVRHNVQSDATELTSFRLKAKTFLSRRGPNWLTVKDVLNNPHMRDQVMFDDYAGANPMAHHDFDPDPGLYGALQLFLRSGSAEAAKFVAGSSIVSARWNRIQGRLKEARQALADASYFRRRAYELRDQKDNVLMEAA